MPLTTTSIEPAQLAITMPPHPPPTPPHHEHAQLDPAIGLFGWLFGNSRM